MICHRRQYAKKKRGTIMMNTEFLKLLEGIRTPFLDSLFSIITTLGEETIFIVAGLLFFWCINKKQGKQQALSCLLNFIY